MGVHETFAWSPIEVLPIRHGHEFATLINRIVDYGHNSLLIDLFEPVFVLVNVKFCILFPNDVVLGDLALRCYDLNDFISNDHWGLLTIIF